MAFVPGLGRPSSPCMASRALVARLTSTVSNWPWSAISGGRPGSAAASMRMPPPRVRASISRRLSSNGPASTGPGFKAPRRAKLSRRRVTDAPRSAASTTSPARRRTVSGSSGRRWINRAPPAMACRTLLKSCATPSANWPSASMRCDWRRSSSARMRWVRASVTRCSSVAFRACSAASAARRWLMSWTAAITCNGRPSASCVTDMWLITHTLASSGRT